MKYIKHKTSGHECTVTDEDWEKMKTTPLLKNPSKSWASGYKILQDAPEPTKVSSNFIPPEVQLVPPAQTIDSQNLPGVKYIINPTSPEETKTEKPTQGSKKQQPKNKQQ